jgi:hypothetical protein
MQRREHDRDRIVGTGIDVEDHFPRHAASVGVASAE